MNDITERPIVTAPEGMPQDQFDLIIDSVYSRLSHKGEQCTSRENVGHVLAATIALLGAQAPSAETSAELLRVGELLRTQDNRCTDQPLFAVMDKREIAVPKDHHHDRVAWIETKSGDYREADPEKVKKLEAMRRSGRRPRGWERHCMLEVDVFVTACFTEQGCKDFLARDGHNHRKPFIYAFGSHRNHEYRAVRDFLATLPAPAREDA